MRRISVLLAGAVILLTVAVAYTYKLSLDRNRRHHPAPVPHIAKKYKGEALQGWRWNSDDAETNKPASLGNTGRAIVAIDVVGAGDGQLVLVVQGSSARMTDVTKNLPADAVIVGIVDSAEYAGKTFFKAQG